jgi:hypothetical protein
MWRKTTLGTNFACSHHPSLHLLESLWWCKYWCSTADCSDRILPIFTPHLSIYPFWQLSILRMLSQTFLKSYPFYQCIHEWKSVMNEMDNQWRNFPRIMWEIWPVANLTCGESDLWQKTPHQFWVQLPRITYLDKVTNMNWHCNLRDTKYLLYTVYWDHFCSI